MKTDEVKNFPVEKTFIEESFPVREVSKESAGEKNIRYDHISILQKWWVG
jgi:adenine-specific DNA methylase